MAGGVSIDVLEEGGRDAAVPGFTRTGNAGMAGTPERPEHRNTGYAGNAGYEGNARQGGNARDAGNGGDAEDREPENPLGAGTTAAAPAPRRQSTNTPSSRRTQPDAAMAPPSTCNVVPLTNADMSPAR